MTKYVAKTYDDPEHDLPPMKVVGTRLTLREVPELRYVQHLLDGRLVDPATVVDLTANAFCPTGQGGGVDPSCSPSGSGSSGHKDLTSLKTRMDETHAKLYGGSKGVKLTPAQRRNLEKSHLEDLAKYKAAKDRAASSSARPSSSTPAPSPPPPRPATTSSSQERDAGEVSFGGAGADRLPKMADVRDVPAADVGRVHAVVDRLGVSSYGLVHLADLKEHLGWDKSRMGRALQAARVAGKLWLVKAEGRGGLSQRDRDAGFEEEGRLMFQASSRS